MQGFVIAGTHSGVGKTSITIGLLSLFRENGLRPQPFKVGPDFIDPSLHTIVSGRPSRNLDSWLLTPKANQEIFCNAIQASDVAVVEGMMGLFDGANGQSDVGSTASIAKLLGLPVILVVDASAISRSAAALVLGFAQMDPALKIAGVILNRVGGELHQRWLKTAIQQRTGIPIFGCIPFDPELNIPERHLGLIPAAEGKVSGNYLTRLKKQIAKNIDWKKMLRLTEIDVPRTATIIFRKRTKITPVRVALPRDRALNFYYEDSLQILRNLGAELVEFKPAEGDPLPSDVDGIYMGGGFPEYYAAELSSNHRFLQGLRRVSLSGTPIYAECGGLMCLTKAIVGFDGKEKRMAGIIPARAVMQKHLAAIGYVHVKNIISNLLGPRGVAFRGHVFHNSILEAESRLKASYLVNSSGKKSKDGIIGKSFLASYVHVHFGSKPELARNFIRACQQSSQRKTS